MKGLFLLCLFICISLFVLSLSKKRATRSGEDKDVDQSLNRQSEGNRRRLLTRRNSNFVADDLLKSILSGQEERESRDLFSLCASNPETFLSHLPEKGHKTGDGNRIGHFLWNLFNRHPNILEKLSSQNRRKAANFIMGATGISLSSLWDLNLLEQISEIATRSPNRSLLSEDSINFDDFNTIEYASIDIQNRNPITLRFWELASLNRPEPVFQIYNESLISIPDKIINGLSSGFLDGIPSQAIVTLHEANSGPSKPVIVDSFLRKWLRRDANSMATAVDRLPNGKVRDQGISLLVEFSIYANEPGTANSWFQELSDGSIRERLIKEYPTLPHE